MSERFTEPVVAAQIVHRLGRAALDVPHPWRGLFTLVYVVARVVARVVSSGVDLPRSVAVGPGLRLWHSGPIVVSSFATLGSQCDLGQGVCIGVINAGQGAPRIGNGVSLSSHAHVLGDISIGHGTKVGAMSVVLQDLPPNVTAAGAPARVLGRRSPLP